MPLPLALDAPPPPAVHWVDARVGLNASGFTQGPGGIVLSWLSWWGAYGSFDVAVYQLGPATLSAGMSGSYSRPILLENLAEWAVSVVDREGSWEFDMVTTSWSGDLYAGFRPDSVVQPYAGLGVGRDTMVMGFTYSGSAGSGSGSLSQRGLVITPAAGVEFITPRGFAVDVELGYHIFRTFVTSQQLEVLTASGNPLIAVDKENWQIPPRGFSWAVSAGWRF